MFEPVRGGTRGGQAEFKWSDVSQDKDRENYLGHSINAPTGRWQKNKDIHWYSRDVEQDEQARLDEIKRIKEIEAEALSAALGFASGSKPGVIASAGPATGSNAVAVAPTNAAGSSAPSDAQREAEKEEKRKRKAERKEEKRARKEEKKRRKAVEDDDDHHSRHHGRHTRSRSRSRSPPRRHTRDDSPHRLPRARTPPARESRGYDESDRERERERARRRWEDNAQRDRPGAKWGRD